MENCCPSVRHSSLLLRRSQSKDDGVRGHKARSCNENNRFSSLPMRILPAGTHSFTARNQPGGMNFYSKAHLAIKQLLGENMRQKPPTSHVQKVMVHPQIAYMHKKNSACLSRATLWECGALDATGQTHESAESAGAMSRSVRPIAAGL